VSIGHPALYAFALGLLITIPACSGAAPRVHAALTESAARHDVLALSDALEALIAEGKDTPEDRDFAFREVQQRDDGTAGYAFARAAVIGRYVQGHGLTKGPLIAEMERYARQSRALDPSFRGSAATRMLGTLYVLVPASLLKHGNSEDGLSMLEGLVKAHPEVMENRLRVAEAYMALNDPGPAYPHLCQCIAQKAALRRDDQRLLERLVKEAGDKLRCDAAPASSATPSAAPSPSPSVAPSAAPSPSK
jgi:hypothetical protein